MQKPLTPRQKLEVEKLDHAIKQAESDMMKAELACGKASPQYAVAERQRDEILARMQRFIRVQDEAGTDLKPAVNRVVTVVRSKRIINRK